MALFNATSLAGAVLLLYLSSFVLLAILRIATGISIQRIGYFSLRHISFTPREGIRIDLRGLGLSLHRPTFAQPTWLSLVFTELKVTLDPAAPESSKSKQHAGSSKHANSLAEEENFTKTHQKQDARSELWTKLTRTKEKLKRLHRKIKWLRTIDLSANQTTLEVVGVGSVHVAAFTIAVHTRRKLLDRGRLFRHKKDPLGDQRPAEWMLTVKSVLLGVGTCEPVEILDVMSVNVHGLLYEDQEGLRDTSIAVKAGRLHVPVDDLLLFSRKSKPSSKSPLHARPTKSATPTSPMSPFSPISEISFQDVVEELDRPGSREAAIVQTVADSKEFFSSILRGVQEVQVGLSFARVSKELQSLRQANLPLTANIVTHEIGVDLHRVDHNSPAHRMYFPREDVAHQALVAAVSISLSLDEDERRSHKIMYIPMATTTIRTTLPSKTVSFANEADASKRNTNILFANLVVTSPSLDLQPQHIMHLIALTPKHSKSTEGSVQTRHRLISRLLPKASVKLSIHEPVVRFVLPVADSKYAGPGEFDMIIAAVSSISLDLESSHSIAGEHLYSLASHFRIVSYQLYYQSASDAKHNLMVMETLELKANVTASSEVMVTVSGNLRAFSMLMVREEVSKSVYNIVRHFKRTVEAKKLDETPKPKSPAFVRRLPSWLLELHFEGSQCSIETAGIDHNISSQTRGLALELDSWTVDYRSVQAEFSKSPSTKRKASNSVRQDESFANVHHLSPPTSPSKHHTSDPTDGRRMTLHGRGLNGFIIEAIDHWEAEPFLSLPRFELACSTSRDQQGPMFHVHAAIRAFYLDNSLYRFYSIGVAGSIVKDAFLGPPQKVQHDDEKPVPKSELEVPSQSRHVYPGPVELVTLDLKAGYVQVKAHLPSDPPLMLQLFNVSAGRHRWSAPFLRADLVRLHAQSPHLKKCWARLVALSYLRVDLRHSKKRTQHGHVEERSIDVSTEFFRISVPHGLHMYLVFDNIVNTIKAFEQLRHRFKTRTMEYVLKKGPKGPSKIPRVSVRAKALMFDLEDDPFEWKLGLIYHVGQVEQKQRLAREDAYKLKLRKLNEKNQRSTSRYRNQSARARSPVGPKETHRRSRSQDSWRGPSPPRGRRGRSPRDIRYDREGTCGLSEHSKIHADEAWRRLQEHSSRSWKKRIDWVTLLRRNTIKGLRKAFTGFDQPPVEEGLHNETILELPYRIGLMTTFISDLHLVVDKPSFDLSKLPNFLHEIGKGMPYTTQYSLLVPMSWSLDMGEARVMLRDYPLNLLHIPGLRPGQSPRLPSWSLKTDIVIAEEFRDEESIRHVKVDIVPKGQQSEDGSDIPGFSIDVRRTVSPVKTYSKPVIDINTSLPTTISWGQSYQPVIQDMMMIIESFTKPVIDPSDRVGFWDKIRLSFHSRVTINWKGDGDMQLRLKGSRDPYIVTGYGAGFVMCWRNDVQWCVHANDDPRQFMTVRSGEYVLAIPDYSHEARSVPERAAEHDTDSLSSTSSQKNAAVFQKVIMKVSGNVQWTAGLVFERDLKDDSRTSNFIPHYDVVLKNPTQMQHPDLSGYDAYRGFRSQHIHLSVSVSAPYDRDWTSNISTPSLSYNSIHLSPKFFSHFFNWWSLFHGVMSLPIRQGPLWRGPEKTSKKFGRHLATIKYGLTLSPLFLAHIYKHKDAEDYHEDVVSATGLKIRIDSFVLDIHQRREFFDTLSKSKSKQMRTSAMKIYKAELDFIKADLRAVAASIAGTTAEDLRKATEEQLSAYLDADYNIDMSQFEIPDHDFSWIDMDDFVELDWILPSKSNPMTKILPLAYTPRFTYIRQTQHGASIQGDDSRHSQFGDEDTHFCVMAHHNDPSKVQMSLIDDRLEDIEKKLKSHVTLMGEHELRVIRDSGHDVNLKKEQESMDIQKRELESKKRFLQNGLRRLAAHSHPGEVGDPDSKSSPTSNGNPSTTELPGLQSESGVDMDGLFSAPHDEFASDFNNRFIIHNIQLKWNNALRNTVLRYSHQVSQRRGFVYYMSRRAVKFILDIVQEQSVAKETQRRKSTNTTRAPSVLSPSEEKDEDTVVQDRIAQLLNDAQRFVDVDDPEHAQVAEERQPSAVEFGDTIADNFQPMNSYHIRFIAPQIQLQSEKNTKSVVLVSAKGMQLKIVAIMDKARMSDEVSGLVQRRYALDMDGAQFFITNQKALAKYLHLYSGNRYGNSPGSDWPPWVALEAMFDFHLNPFGFQRVIQRTSASLRYEKYNPLRLKYNEEVATNEKESENTKKSYGSESRIDHLWIDFPRIRASCDSTQYYTMYIIALDLLLYSEPLEKTRNERLEKIMLASDFSDLRGAPEMAEKLQERIRQLEELKLHFQINASLLDKQGWEDRINLEKDLASCEDELFFIMKAINTSQQRNEEKRDAQSSGFLRWYLSASEIVWHLMRDKDEPLLEFQLGNAAYERIDNSDGSNHNAMEIQNIRGWNLLRSAIYPEIIGPYHEPHQKRPSLVDHQKMLQVRWYMLEAIAGIPVLEDFEVKMHPLRVQLERDLAKRLFEYIFPGQGSNAFDGGGFPPLSVKNMQPINDEEEDETESARLALNLSRPDLQPTSTEMRRTSSAGALGRRLKPTYHLQTPGRPGSSDRSKPKAGLGVHADPHGHRVSLFRSHRVDPEPRQSISQPPTPVPGANTPSHKISANSLRSLAKDKGSTTSLSALGGKEQHEGGEKRWGLHRHNSHDQNNATANGQRRSHPKSAKDAKPTDDVSQMMSRASNYMTLAHVKLDSFVVCLSYKGKSDRNIEDLRDFVFRLPTLEYSNKTWSNLDLALRLKKDVIRALISHTGAIIGNKLSHHRPSKRVQLRERENASRQQVIENGDYIANTPSTSETGSLYSVSIQDEDSPRMSFQTSSARASESTLLMSNPGGSPTSANGSGMLHPSVGNGITGLGVSTHPTAAGPGNLMRSGSWASSIHTSAPLSQTSLANIQLTKDGGVTIGQHSRGGLQPPRSVPPGFDGNGAGQASGARPTTSGSNHHLGRSLLRETLGRHFSTDTVKEMKGKVRFSSSIHRSPSRGDGEEGRGRRGSGSGTIPEEVRPASAHAREDIGSKGEPEFHIATSVGGGVGENEEKEKRKSVLGLGKRVLERLGDL